MWGILWSFYNGFGVSIVTRVGKKIGGGHIAEAQLSAKMGLVLSLIACTCTASIVYALSDKLAMVYSNDPEVVQTMKPCVRIVCVTYIIGGSGWAAMSILEAMSKNKAKGIINVLCAWCGYAPACVFLMTDGNSYKYIGTAPADSVFVVGLVVEFVRSAALWIVVCTADWNKASEDAKQRNERYDEMAGDGEMEKNRNGDDAEEYQKLEEDDGGGVDHDVNLKNMSIGGAYDLMENAASAEAASSA